jgi:hypothetical protein
MSTHASKLDKHRDQDQNIILPKTSKHTSELGIYPLYPDCTDKLNIAFIFKDQV